MKVTPRQLHWFRLRRNGLVDPFTDPQETASRLLGVQGQMMAAAEIAFWNRTADCGKEELDRARLEDRTLVRMWGQRGTVHVYSTRDWPFLRSALAHRRKGLDKGLAKWEHAADFPKILRRVRKKLRSGAELTHKDIAPEDLGKQEGWVVSYLTLHLLVVEGEACYGPDRGAESCFVHREHWVPELDWSPPDPESAGAELARRYLSSYGPAEPADLAFWSGGTVGMAKDWIRGLGDACREIQVGGKTLLCLEEDLDELREKPPVPSRWPVRLLYRFDPLVLATKDKSWLVDEANAKKVWRPAAHVEPVLLVKGRIEGTWRYDRRASGLRVEMRPFAPLARTVRARLESQAAGVADFLGLELGDVRWPGKRG